MENIKSKEIEDLLNLENAPLNYRKIKAKTFDASSFSPVRISESTFHQTDHYVLLEFYKPISKLFRTSKTD
ncbi:hypothetical protein [Kordia sp.]|uniref:hypothetical protein n=1 Tax=Kordia sp. TaxID=1965332 RepID=UPI003B5A8FCB